MGDLPSSKAEARASGSRFYFTGEPCVKGHTVKRYTSGGVCIGCINDRRHTPEYRRVNAERKRRARANATPEERERRRQYKREWKKRSSARPSLFADRVRTRIYNAIRRACAGANSKHGRTTELLGCSIPEYRVYLEKRFLPGMTWDNFGEWHVDHIVAVSRFNLATPEGQQSAFHYTNTQPLWGPDNLAKGAC